MTLSPAQKAAHAERMKKYRARDAAAFRRKTGMTPAQALKAIMAAPVKNGKITIEVMK